MDLLLQNSKYVEHYTYPDGLFSAIPQFRNYLYYISDLEFNYCEDERLQGDEIFINGEELFEIITKNKSHMDTRGNGPPDHGTSPRHQDLDLIAPFV